MNYEPEHDFDTDERPVSSSWHHSVTDDLERSNKRAWTVAIVAALIALLLAIALVILLPLKTVEPYTLLVDRQTGNVEALSPTGEQTVTPDEALVRSFLVQYVTSRESFAIDSLQDDYRKVSLWSDNDTRREYSRAMDADNASSPLSRLPRRAVLKAEVKSVSRLEDGKAMVRFTTNRQDSGAFSRQQRHWVSIISYGFSNAEMSEDDRFINPLGFQVTSYRRDAETVRGDDGGNSLSSSPPVIDLPPAITSGPPETAPDGPETAPAPQTTLSPSEPSP